MYMRICACMCERAFSSRRACPLSMSHTSLLTHTYTYIHTHTHRFKAIKNRARRTGDKIKARFQPSFSFIARLILRSILLLLICAFAPFLIVFALFHDWLMKKFINYAYIYNVSWEDPRMDQEVFNLKEDDHIITIASAGCNVLDYIIEGGCLSVCLYIYICLCVSEVQLL